MSTSRGVWDLSAGSGSGAHRGRGREARKSGAQGAPQIVPGIAVTARKPRAAKFEDGSHWNGEGALREQFPRHPKIHDAPIRLWKALGNVPSPHAVLIDLDGLGRREVRHIGNWAITFQGGCGWRGDPRGRLQPVFRLGSQAGAGVQELDPGLSAEGAALGLLVGEPGQSSEMAPVGAGGVAAVSVGEAPGDSRGQSRRQRLLAEVEPGLQTARAGLNHNAGLESIPAHGFEHFRASLVEIEQKVARVPALSVRMQVDIASLPIAQAEEADGGRAHQLGGAPQPFSGEGCARRVVDQTEQIEIVRHGRELAANRLPGKKETAIQHVTMLRSNGKMYNRFSANGNCVFSAVSHRRGSPH